MERVEDYILAQATPLKTLLLLCHDCLEQDFGLKGKIRHGIPFYFGNHWVCYLNTIRGQKVEMAFLRAKEMRKHHADLDFKKRKMVGGISLSQDEPIDWESLKNILKEAVEIDKNSPYRLK
jgi:hypothetical protein